MLINHVKSIAKDLNKYKDVKREDLLSTCINNKLKATLERYNKELSLNSEYLLTRSSFKVLKALTKLQKKADKELLQAVAKTEEMLNKK